MTPFEPNQFPPGPEERLNSEAVTLACTTCGLTLIMTNKGLACPHCDQERKLVVRKNWIGLYKIIEAIGVFQQESYLTLEECQEYASKGIIIQVLY